MARRENITPEHRVRPPLDYSAKVGEWAGGLPKSEQVIKLFERVRDIPYGTIGSTDPEDVLFQNRGTCGGKNGLLKGLYQAIHIPVRDILVLYNPLDLLTGKSIEPPPLLSQILTRTDTFLGVHNFLQVQVGEKWINVDTTWDAGIKKAGFPVNLDWDGKSDMQTAVISQEQIVVPEDTTIDAMKAKYRVAQSPEQRETRKEFLERFSGWLEDIRSQP